MATTRRPRNSTRWRWRLWKGTSGAKRGGVRRDDLGGRVGGEGKRPVAVIGVDGLVVVDAGDAVLVVPRDKAQDVRKAVEELKRLVPGK